MCFMGLKEHMATWISRLMSLQCVGSLRKRKLSQHPYIKSQRRALIGPDWITCQSWTNHWGLGYYAWGGLDLLPIPGVRKQDTVIFHQDHLEWNRDKPKERILKTQKQHRPLIENSLNRENHMLKTIQQPHGMGRHMECVWEITSSFK